MTSTEGTATAAPAAGLRFPLAWRIFLGSSLVVGAYVTGRVNSEDWLRYSLVVLNMYAFRLPSRLCRFGC